MAVPMKMPIDPERTLFPAPGAESPVRGRRVTAMVLRNQQIRDLRQAQIAVHGFGAPDAFPVEGRDVMQGYHQFPRHGFHWLDSPGGRVPSRAEYLLIMRPMASSQPP